MAHVIFYHGHPQGGGVGSTNKFQVREKLILVGGWTNPVEKYARQSQFGSWNPNFRGEH